MPVLAITRFGDNVFTVFVTARLSTGAWPRARCSDPHLRERLPDGLLRAEPVGQHAHRRVHEQRAPLRPFTGGNHLAVVHVQADEIDSP